MKYFVLPAITCTLKVKCILSMTLNPENAPSFGTFKPLHQRRQTKRTHFKGEHFIAHGALQALVGKVVISLDAKHKDTVHASLAFHHPSTTHPHQNAFTHSQDRNFCSWNPEVELAVQTHSQASYPFAYFSEGASIHNKKKQKLILTSYSMLLSKLCVSSCIRHHMISIIMVGVNE